MFKNDDKKGARNSFTVSVLKGVPAGMCVILILFALAAALITSGRLPEGAMKVVVWICAFLGSLAGSWYAVKLHGSRALLTACGVGGTIFLVTLIGSAISDNGGIVGSATPGVLIALVLGSLCGGFLGVSKRKRRH